MQEFETTLTERGQVTIPIEVRRILGLHPRDRVRFEVEGKVVRISQASSKILPFFGSVTPRKKPEDFQELREEFEKGVAEEVTLAKFGSS
jgi:AbrB family looped-hinge helix DNA binding protein